MKKFSRSPGSSQTGIRPATKKRVLSQRTPPTEQDITGKLFDKRLIAVNSGMVSLKGLPVTGVEELMLDHNHISTFVGFAPIPSLKRLSINGANFSDFRAFPKLPSLEYISLKGSPVMSHPQARIALIILCPALKTINDQAVTGCERQLAKMYPAKCTSSIRAGWMPTIPPPKEDEIENINRRMAELRWQNHKKEQSQVVKVLKEPAMKILQSESLDQQIEAQEMEIERLEREIKLLKLR